MLDHIGLTVPASQFAPLVAWYLTALAPLGYTKQVDYPGQAVGFGPRKGEAPFWIAVARDSGDSGDAKQDAKQDAKGGGVKGEGVKGEGGMGMGMHLAFKAKDHEAVGRFYEEAVRAGGRGNGEPGLREYQPGYYAAFVWDLVG